MIVKRAGRLSVFRALAALGKHILRLQGELDTQKHIVTRLRRINAELIEKNQEARLRMLTLEAIAKEAVKPYEEPEWLRVLLNESSAEHRKATGSV